MILNYYLMPHPPIIIPEVGKGEEKRAIKTINACIQIGKEIKNLDPDTIIIITPHGVMFKDCITLSYENMISGDLSRFNAKSVELDIHLDLKLTDEICHLASTNNISTLKVNSQVLSKYHRQYTLDHGALIPLTFINGNYKLVHITYGLLQARDLFRFGTLIKEAVDKLNRKAVVIASGDLSHRLSEDGPYPFSPSGKIFDETLLRHLINGDVFRIFNLNKKLVEEAGECGLRSIYILLGCIRTNFTGELLSYEGPYGVGYGVMKFISKYSGDNLENIENRKTITKGKNDDYVILARRSIAYYFNHNEFMKVPENISKELIKSRAGVFVTLKKYGELRGCIGSFLPITKNIASEIIRNAVAAAFEDPRFEPLTLSELDEVIISVDVLTLPVKATKDELNPKVYGVIVSSGHKRGLLLPDLEGIDTVENQLYIACRKARINPNSQYEIEKFSVNRHYEVDYE